jgi:hypothetical protein
LAEVDSVHGSAYVLQSSGKLTRLSVGDSVLPGDVITTGGFDVARVTLRCPDDTRIQLENSTRVCILGEPAGPQVQLCYGEVSTDVPADSADPSFDVPAYEVMIAAAGCNTKVGRDSCVYIQEDLDGSEFAVSVERGSVDCADPNDSAKGFTLAENRHALVGGGFEFVTRVDRFGLHLSPRIVDPPGQFGIPGEIQYGRGVAFDGTYLWVANGARYYYHGARDVAEKRWLFKVDPQSREVIGTLDLGDKCDAMGPAGLAWDGKHLWAADVYGQNILKIDPNDPVAPVVDVISAKRLGIEQLAVSDGMLWGLGKANRRRDDVVHRYNLAAGKWLPLDERDVIPGDITGFYALTGRGGSPYLHVVDLYSDMPGCIYRLDQEDCFDQPVWTGSERGARVRAMCPGSEPNEWWMLSRDWGWMRPMKTEPVKPRVEGKPAGNAAATGSERHADLDTRPAFAGNRDEDSLPRLQPARPASQGGPAVLRDRKSLTVVSPQLESKIVPNKKVLCSLNLHQGRISPPFGCSRAGLVRVPQLPSNTNLSVSFVRRKGSIHA